MAKGIGLPDFGGAPGVGGPGGAFGTPAGDAVNAGTPAPAGSPGSSNPAAPGGTVGTPPAAFSSKRITRRRLNLTTARDNEKIDLTGTLVWMSWANDPAALIEVGLGDENQSQPLYLVPGAAIGGIPFNRLFITHAAQEDVIVELVVSSDRPGDRIDVR